MFDVVVGTGGSASTEVVVLDEEERPDELHRG